MPRGGFFHNLAKRGIAEVKHQLKEQGLQQVQSVAQTTGISGFVPTGAIQVVAQQVQTIASDTGLTSALSTVQSVGQEAQQQAKEIAADTGLTTVVQQTVSTVQSVEQQTQQQIQTIAANTGVSTVVSQSISTVQSVGQQAQQQIQSVDQQVQQQLQSITANTGLDSQSQQDASGQDAQNTSDQSDNSSDNPSSQDVSKDLHDLSRLGRVVYNSVGDTQKPQQSSMITVAEVEPYSPGSITLDGCSGQNAMKEGYCAASMPPMNVCVSCYQKYISTSWFASSFKRVDYFSGSKNGCDLAVKAVQDVWTTINAMAAHQQGALLQQLTQQVGQITSQQGGNASQMNIARKQVQGKQEVTLEVVKLTRMALPVVGALLGGS